MCVVLRVSKNVIKLIAKNLYRAHIIMCMQRVPVWRVYFRTNAMPMRQICLLGHTLSYTYLNKRLVLRDPFWQFHMGGWDEA